MTKRTPKPKDRPRVVANHEVVVVAALLAGAKTASVDTEDIAMKANELAPGRFTWRKYKDQINIDIVANAGMQNAPASDSVEGILMSVLDQYGPVMDGETFARRSVDAGVNPISFYIYRANSPLISALGKGVYAKVGAEVAPGTVEDIVGRRNIAPRISEYGWTPAGRLWFGFELSLQTMTAGGIRIVSFVADLVQGEWNIYLPDNTECSSATCRENFIWSFRKAFALLGAEPGDLAAFEFDLQTRAVRVRVGGPGLFEQIEDPGTLSEDDEPPDDGKLELET